MRPTKRNGTLGAAGLLLASGALASNHREAPITGLDPKADITDVYAFVSYDADQQPGEAPEKVTLLMCVDPLLEPANGPTLFPFDPSIQYEIKIDNDQDALADRILRFRFETEYQLPDVYTAVAGIGPNGAVNPTTGALVVPPQITDFQNPGLNQRQNYSVEFIDPENDRSVVFQTPSALYAVPGNAGSRTMDYDALFSQATYSLAGGAMKVFAGTVDDPFFIDLGATFDTANFRTLSSGVPGVQTDAENDATTNFASDTVSGFAVNAIAVEVPIGWLTSTGQIEASDSPEAMLGVWCTTSRQRVTVRNSPEPATYSGPWRQVQRLGNPLINELVIGIGSKDRFSMDQPANDDQFAGFFLDPPIVKIVEAIYGGALSVPDAPRLDLLPLVNYTGPTVPAGTNPGPIADVLRLNTGISATPIAMQSRLGLLAGDAAGFPNGRRPGDDVVDITLRVAIGGVLAAPFPGFTPGVNDRLGDGVNVNDAPFRTSFPYFASCPSGRDRRHIDPGEPGGGPVQ